MKGIRYFFGPALLFLLLLSSCTPGIFQQSTATPTPTLEPTRTITSIPPTTTPEPTPTEDLSVQIKIINDTSEPVCAIFVYTSETSGDLPNHLNGAVLMDGNGTDLELEIGTYNIDVWDCQMNQLHALSNFYIEEAFEWNLSETPEQYVNNLQESVILINQRAWDICEFYIRSAVSEEWGENLFHPEFDYYLTSGSTLIEPIEAGVYDMRLIYCDGTLASQMDDLEIPEGQTMTWTLTP